jgi:hypothetical protein
VAPLSARHVGLFETRRDELSGLEAVDEHVVLHLANGAPVVADRLICATGFEADVRAN